MKLIVEASGFRPLASSATTLAAAFAGIWLAARFFTAPPSGADVLLSDLEGVRFGKVPGFIGLSDGAESCGVTRPSGAALGAGASSPPPSEGVVKDGVPKADPPAFGATQLTALPPLVPEQLHVHGPWPLTALEIPAEQSEPLGMVSVGTPLEAPHMPTIGGGGVRGAVQLTVMPPFTPIQLQFHGPLPLISDVMPAEQRLSVGRSSKATPLEDPQSPFSEGPGGGGAFGITLDVVHVLAMPPFMPEQVHVHGPSPLTALATPLSHKLTVGAAGITAFAAAPQVPSTLVWVCEAAEQLTLTPPPEPTQLHIHGPDPVTSVLVPLVQRSERGADLWIEPFTGPQIPSESLSASHMTLALDFPLASHVHFHGPVPRTAVALPARQRSSAGKLSKLRPAEAPHWARGSFLELSSALVAGASSALLPIGAEQALALPPSAPLQFHSQTPLERSVFTELGVPDVQRPVRGSCALALLVAAPHAPSLAESVEQLVWCPASSMQAQLHGPSPVTAVAVPAAQRRSSGFAKESVSEASPQRTTDSTASLVPSEAAQLTVWPPSTPMQLQFHGPRPVTRDARPEAHRPSFGVLS